MFLVEIEILYMEVNESIKEANVRKISTSYFEKAQVNFIRSEINKHPLVMLALKARTALAKQTSWLDRLVVSRGKHHRTRWVPPAKVEHSSRLPPDTLPVAPVVLVSYDDQTFSKVINVPVTAKLFVVLPDRLTKEEDVHVRMKKYGKLEECRVVTATGVRGECGVQGTHKGCAIVKFADAEHANKAVRELNGQGQSKEKLAPLIVKWVCRAQALEDGFRRQPHVQIGRIEYEHVHQDPGWRSALEVVVQHEIQAFHFANDTDWPQSFFEDLVREKWFMFARKVHIIWRLLPFFLGSMFYIAFISARICAVWAVLGIDRGVESRCGLILIAGDSNEIQKTMGPIVFALSIPALLYWGYQDKRLRKTDLDPNEDLNISVKELVLFLFKNMGAMVNIAITICLVVHARLTTLKFDATSLRTLAPEHAGADAVMDATFCDAWCQESMVMACASLFIFSKLLHLVGLVSGVSCLLSSLRVYVALSHVSVSVSVSSQSVCVCA